MNSHDVRKLRVCLLCGSLGIYKSEKCVAPTVINVAPDATREQFVHPRCYQEEMGTAKLLSMPSKELRFIRMSDVSQRTMQRILDLARDS